MENGDFGGTLDVSTFLSSFLAFFTAFFSFFASFRSPFVFLDIQRAPPFEAALGLAAYESSHQFATHAFVRAAAIRWPQHLTRILSHL